MYHNDACHIYNGRHALLLMLMLMLMLLLMKLMKLTWFGKL